MSATLTSFEAFDALLAQSRVQIDAMALADPADGTIAMVKAQLAELHALTRDGRDLDQAEKDSFNFGAIGSRELCNYPVADSLYELGSYVTWWGETNPGY